MREEELLTPTYHGPTAASRFGWARVARFWSGLDTEDFRILARSGGKLMYLGAQTELEAHIGHDSMYFKYYKPIENESRTFRTLRNRFWSWWFFISLHVQNLRYMRWPNEMLWHVSSQNARSTLSAKLQYSLIKRIIWWCYWYNVMTLYNQCEGGNLRLGLY